MAIQEAHDEQYSHAEKLAVFVDQVIKEIGGPDKLDAICVSKGPGSYTGLRIGVSAAKGLCFALDIPLISATSLESLAELARTQANTRPDDVLMPMIDARRMEVYTAQFDHLGKQLSKISALVVDEKTELNSGSKTIIFGDGSAKCTTVLKSKNAVHLPGIKASAIGMIHLAEAKYFAKDFEDLAYFEPFYLKEFTAGKPKNIF